MHRWTRGDWQSLPWLFRRVKTADGTMQQNFISQIDRWKIADNLRRSLVPIFSFASIYLSMLLDNSDFLWAGLVAILAAASHRHRSTVDIFSKNRGRVNIIRQSSAGSVGLLQTLIRLIFCIRGMGMSERHRYRALQVLISHKYLLTWVTAAESEHKTETAL